jgi:hypothetical protein
MKFAKDILPWKVTSLDIRPFDGFWSFNNSVHYDGSLWRCVLRCCDYAMPNGKTIRGSKAGPGHQTKNAMAILDPTTWQPIKVYKMRELDEYPRVPCANVGYEDMRIFRTDRGGLQGIAASLHLKREAKAAAGGAQHQPPEQVLLSFDAEYNIVKAKPIRGDWWSGTAQKNWVPFDDVAEPRFLYSIGKGTLFDDRGALNGSAAVVRPSTNARSFVVQSVPVEPVPEVPAVVAEELPSPPKEEKKPPKQHVDPRTRLGGGSGDVRVRGRRVSHDSITTRPTQSAAFLITRTGKVSSETSTRVLGTGRALPPRYEGLRGGTQLVRIGEDAWLGIGHEMQFVPSKKFYWHPWYVVDSRGKMTSASEPCKLASEGIEFAAGLAIDGDRVVVSFGVDDFACRLGVTSLSAVMGVLKPVDR